MVVFDGSGFRGNLFKVSDESKTHIDLEGSVTHLNLEKDKLDTLGYSLYYVPVREANRLWAAEDVKNELRVLSNLLSYDTVSLESKIENTKAVLDYTSYKNKKFDLF